MDIAQSLAAIEQLVAKGNTEQGIEQLVTTLSTDTRYAELAQIARINQADLYQLKAKILKGTIANDEERLSRNAINDNIFQIIQRVNSGKFTFSDPVGITHTGGSSAWRAYLAGGVIALTIAVLAWRFLGGGTAKPECLVYKEAAKWKIMVLPFRQTGANEAGEPEIDIAEGLNLLIERTPGMDATVLVNSDYDIEKKYPTPDEVVELANNCGVQMVIWGKINQNNGGKEYKLDIRYKITDGTSTKITGDTTLTNLLKMNDEGQLIRDLDVATRLLYMTIANKTRVPIASRSSALSTMIASARMDSSSVSDTNNDLQVEMQLSRAQALIDENKDKEAIAVLDEIIEQSPDNQVALLKRGAIYYKMKNYTAAARDLEMVNPSEKSNEHDILKVRTDAFIKSSQPEKGSQDIQALKRISKTDGAWLTKQQKTAADSTLAIETRLVANDKKLAKSPQNKKYRIKVVQDNLALGNNDAVIRHADEITKKDPANAEAHAAKIAAYFAKGDTVSVRKELESARRAGVTAKNIAKFIPRISQLKN